MRSHSTVKQWEPGGTRAKLPAWVAITLLIGAGAAWARAQPTAQTQPSTQRRRPAHTNVVIFLIDTLRADHLGVYGYDRRPTSPRIDALAREAVVFEQACAPTPWTLPTVVSLMTSTFPCEHRTLHDYQRLSNSLTPLAERLRSLRYNTLGVYANVYAGPRFGLDRGYTVLQYSPENDGEKVGRLLDTYRREPFFLYIHNTEPHTPHRFAPPHTEGFRDVPGKARKAIKNHYRAYRSLTRVDFAQKRAIGTTDTTKQQKRRLAALTKLRDDYLELYDASVRLADTYVGSVIDSLKQRGLWENTLFILLADHGEEFNEHSGWLHDQSVYQELVHVPLIIRFPQDQYAGQRVQTVVSLVDILPTIFDYLQRPRLAHGARGRSLMPLIRGDEPDGTEDFIVPAMRVNVKKYYRPWKESRGDINLVVRKGHWKGIWNFEPKTLELYDLSNDPGEQHDVSAANPELALAMRVFARLWTRECRANLVETPKPTAQPNEETLRNLRELGYVD